MKKIILSTAFLLSISLGISSPLFAKEQEIIPQSLVKSSVLGDAKTKQKNEGESELEKKPLCGDLLSIYGEKPQHLIFQKCKFSPDSQTPAVAVYTVSNAYSKSVENFLVSKYGMHPLQWRCRYGVSVWSPSEKYTEGLGEIVSSKLTKINSNYALLIEMSGSRIVRVHNEPCKQNRGKIKEFKVIVSIFNI